MRLEILRFRGFETEKEKRRQMKILEDNDPEMIALREQQEALQKGCKIVGSRWVDVDRGDTNKPDYRSRLVAKEINTGYEEGLYARPLL